MAGLRDIVQEFNEDRFAEQWKNALKGMKTVLENTKEPLLAENVPHTYQDKYRLAVFLGNSAIISLFSCLDILGINASNLRKMKQWSQDHSVTLRFRGVERCDFLREEIRKEESQVQHVSERESSLLGSSKRTDKVITKITEYYWKFHVQYELIAFQSTKVSECAIITSKERTYEIKTTTNITPKPKVSVLDDMDINFTWFLQQLNENLQSNFNIDRTAKDCFTPRRNQQVEESLIFWGRYFIWSSAVENYFRSQLFPTQDSRSLDLSCINNSDVLVPVLPMFNEQYSPDQLHNVILPRSEVEKFMEEQKRSLEEKITNIARSLPLEENLITQAEGKLILSLVHARSIIQYYVDAVYYIEEMIRKQLISAIGKELQSSDLVEYMQFHLRRLFKDKYAPQLFCNAIRRPNHYPEGILSVETQDGRPVSALVHQIENDEPMSFAINAACNIRFRGQRFVHAWLDHRFSGESGVSLRLSARARQFSSFILVIGNMISADSFSASHAIIIQNKDDLLIPLLLEQIPTPQAFRDAIESLSPEQQRFAKAFRSMQLESTLFGVCVIQIKPQLERVLHLPDDSLTKEIELTQDLMELFITYQIPSDLLSYDGTSDQNVTLKLDRVKNLVTAMREMIRRSKERELEEARQKAALEATKIQPPIRGFSGKGLFGSGRVVMGSQLCKGGGGGRGVSWRGSINVGPRGGGRGFSKGRGAPPSRGTGSRGAPPSRDTGSRGGRAAPSRGSPASVIASTPVVSASNTANITSKTTPETIFEPEQITVDLKGDLDGEVCGETFDVTKLPSLLDQNFEKMDTDASLHSTIIKVGKDWVKKAQQGLLSKIECLPMDLETQKKERDRAFDLLDALSRSGVLDIHEAEFHVVLAATHCFDETLMNCLVQKNVNPIEKLERSLLIIASTITKKSPKELVNSEFLDILGQNSPKCFLNE